MYNVEINFRNSILKFNDLKYIVYINIYIFINVFFIFLLIYIINH